MHDLIDNCTKQKKKANICHGREIYLLNSLITMITQASIYTEHLRNTKILSFHRVCSPVVTCMQVASSHRVCSPVVTCMQVASFHRVYSPVVTCMHVDYL